MKRTDHSGQNVNLGDRRLPRREFLRWGAWGVAGAAGAGGWAASALGKSEAKRTVARPRALAVAAANVQLHIAATDGHIELPGRDPLYVFGFVEAPLGANANDLDELKGNVKIPAPTIYADEGDDVYLTMTNLGFVVRPDLDDSHTVHWHGFRNQSAIFDGVPEVSIAVPVARNFPYFFHPRDPGTYMYHCHFEDVEHVQLGMDGNIFVRPAQNAGSNKYVYNDGDGSTAYHREFALLLNEIDSRPHDFLESIQEFKWSNYDPNYFVINGRCYPDTIKPNNDPSVPSQPLSSLVQVHQGQIALLRFANLGYQQHAMQLNGIRMRVVGEDAMLLRGPGGADLSYFTNTIYIGPGESRDVLFTAPAYDSGFPGGSDTNGPFNTYWLKNRNYAALTNGGATGLGGMATQVRVYRDPLPAQSIPNETYA